MMRSNKNSKVLVTILTFLVVLAGVSVVLASNGVEYREKDKKCMTDCHGKLNLYYNPPAPWGLLRSAKIDYEKFLNSKHGIFYCVECHREADMAGEKTHFAKETKIHCDSCHIDENSYSEEIKKLFAEKQIRMDDKKRVVADYYESKHGKAYAAKKRNAPYCTGCHDPHNANLSDKDSKVSKANLPSTCGTCHADYVVKGKGFLEKLALLRINGHKKGDSSIDYSYNNCVGCHQGDAIHGKQKGKVDCTACHKKRESLLFSNFHGTNLGVLSYLLNFALVYGAIFVVGFAIFFFAVQSENKKEETGHES